MVLKYVKPFQFLWFDGLFYCYKSQQIPTVINQLAFRYLSRVYMMLFGSRESSAVDARADVSWNRTVVSKVGCALCSMGMGEENKPRRPSANIMCILLRVSTSRLGDVAVSALVTGPKDRGFKPNRSAGF
jgi:hypothetical protein